MSILKTLHNEGAFDADVRNAINANFGKMETGTPASATAAGVAGQVLYDASYIYVCVATNSWTRVSIAAW